MDREDVRVLETRGELDLAQEALGAQGVTEVGMQNLEGDRAVVTEVMRQVNRRHAPVTKLALDGIARRQALLELRTQVGHGLPYMERGAAGK